MTLFLDIAVNTLLIGVGSLILFSLFAPRKMKHDFLGWGYPHLTVGGDSFQPTYSCEYCDGELAQDSQGNYFHLTPTITKHKDEL